ncbi:MAG: 50S ribosomal protein L15 [Duncaniella sp.]|nr:50S ribosomal protein L15 [Muribaculum sp.]MCM1254570.1 50S ribosomal protein L15 [Duncaniella sp.]
MDLSNLQPAVGSVQKKTRIGRGPGSGKGGTSTRGHKGAKSRSGYSRKIGFEGGQMPLQRRLPKFGFKPLKRTVYKAVNLSEIEAIANELNLEKVGVAELIAAGIVNGKQPVKVLAKGAISKKLAVEANAFSEAAEKAIVEAGGTVTKI